MTNVILIILQRYFTGGYDMRRITRLDDNIDEIIERYENGESKQEIADDFDVSRTTIRNRFLEYGAHEWSDYGRGGPIDDCISDIVYRYVVCRDSLQTIADDLETSAQTIKERLLASGVQLRPWTLGFTNEHVSIIQGELLGDGCIYEREPGACHFRLETTTREHAAYLKRELSDGFFPEGHPYSNERTTELGNGPSTRWIVYSRTQEKMAEMHETWYEEYDGGYRKVVPPGYSLDRRALLHWYWGDGSVGYRKDGTPRVDFSTHGFPEESVVRLQRELEEIGYENYTVNHSHVENGSGLAIRLTDGASTPFLEDMVDSNCIEGYAYKFELDNFE